MNTQVTSSLMALSMITVQIANAAPTTQAQVDIAVDLKNNITYIQKTSQNAGGKILVMDNASQETKAEIYVDSVMSHNSRFEIEAGSDSQLYYLVHKSNGQKTLGVIEQVQNEKFETTEIANATDGLYFASGLRAEPNGLVSIQSLDAKTHRPKVTFFEIEKQDGHWTATRTHETSLASLQAAEQKALAMTADAPDPSDASKKYPAGKGVGFTAGLLSGIGFMYRQYFENGIGIHAGGIAWKSESNLWTSFGVEVLKTLSQKDVWRLYTLAGASIYYQNNSNYQTWVPTDPTNPDPDKQGEMVTSTYESTNLNFGAGLGIEVGHTSGVAAAFEVPLSFTFDSNTNTSMHLTGIRPIPSLSLIYYFGK